MSRQEADSSTLALGGGREGLRSWKVTKMVEAGFQGVVSHLADSLWVLAGQAWVDVPFLSSSQAPGPYCGLSAGHQAFFLQQPKDWNIEGGQQRASWRPGLCWCKERLTDLGQAGMGPIPPLPCSHAQGRAQPTPAQGGRVRLSQGCLSLGSLPGEGAFPVS